MNKSLIYQTRKIDAEDLKVGDIFWDAKDGCFYKVERLEKIPVDEFGGYDIGIHTNPPNKRKNQRIRKDRFTKITIQENL